MASANLAGQLPGSDLHLDRNLSTLSGGAAYPQSHYRKGSSTIAGKPLITKPHGGVFQSGPDKTKTVGPPHIMTSNLIGMTPQAMTESP